MSNKIEALTKTVRGRVITRSDFDYDEARAVYNAMHDRKPRAVIQCVDSADEMAAVAAGRDTGLDVAIRGGGHSVPGFGTVQDGLVIDLSRMKSIRIDPIKKVARVGGGATWGDVDHATYPFGLAVPGGIISTTGVGGLTLGGGIGYLTRSCGLSIDNLLSADVVLADGRQVTASDYQNEDLFWALRGGGGNFGVVTSFEFQLHEVGDIVGGPMFYEFDDAAAVLECYREFELTDAAIAAHVEHGKRTPNVHSSMHLHPSNGAASQRVGANETAFGHRHKSFAPVIVGIWPDPADNEANTKWVRDYYAAIHPHSGSV